MVGSGGMSGTTLFVISRFLNRLSVLAAATSIALMAGASQGAVLECSAQSGAHAVALLELYTSEGCSSCPPADRWLKSLPAQGFTSDRVIPLSLHVDYWDYLGWKDPFSQRKFTLRQRRMQEINRLPTIYTPQFIINGKEFGPRGSSRYLDRYLNKINGATARARIHLTLRKTISGGLEVTGNAVVPDRTYRRSADAYLVLYENRLSGAVRAGENRGRVLEHNFVAREFIGPLAITNATGVRLDRTLRLRQDWKTADRNRRVHPGQGGATLCIYFRDGTLGVAAFVQDRRNADVRQALALRIPGKLPCRCAARSASTMLRKSLHVVFDSPLSALRCPASLDNFAGSERAAAGDPQGARQGWRASKPRARRGGDSPESPPYLRLAPVPLRKRLNS